MRRFVGREFLLFLWFESEVFEGTLPLPRTAPGGGGGSLGLTVEKQIVLSVGKEATRIKGGLPAATREAKEALLIGKLPESATLRLSWNDREVGLTLKAERMALSGLSLPVVLGPVDEAPREQLAPRPPPRRKTKRTTVEEEREREDDDQRESFYERMLLTREVEGLLEALYRDFLRIRLGAAWDDLVRPAIATWVTGKTSVDADRYAAERERALGAGGSSRKKRSPAATPHRRLQSRA
jgi:hypothetical protein